MPSTRYFNLNKQKKKRLDDAILNEMTRHTYEHINLSNIVRDAKISRGSLYQYFKDKHDLYVHYIHLISIEKKKYVNNIKSTENSLDMIHQLLLNAIEFSAHNTKYSLIGIKLHESKDNNIMQLIETSNQATITYYQSLLSQDPLYRDHSNLDTISKLIHDMIQGLTHNWIHHLNMNEIKHFVEAFINILKGGISNV